MSSASLDLNVDSVDDDVTSGGREFHVRDAAESQSWPYHSIDQSYFYTWHKQQTHRHRNDISVGGAKI